MPITAPRLSKSRILSGLQCPRRLWLEVFRREAMEEDPGAQARFDAGNRLGELARELYGPGLLIGHVDDIPAALRATGQALAQAGKRSALFEAAFQHEGVVVRADVLVPVRGGYDLVEVKSSSSVKDYHLVDCAVQAWVIQHAGIRLRRVYLAHVDSSFVYQGQEDYDGLLMAEDITADVHDLQRNVPGWIRDLKDVLRGGEPAIKTGDQCSKPFGCPFHDYCRSQEPAGPRYPVSILWHGGKLIKALQEDGLEDLRKVPAERLKSALHQRIRKASITGKTFLDPAAGERLGGLAYPRYYVDFETIDHVIPRWVGTRPYQQIPFQWSCHVEQRSGALREIGFLDLTGGSPVRPFAESLLRALGRRGPILVYNQSFEAGRVRDLAAMIPDIADDLLALLDRMVDLLPITRDHYYHPAMMGSWSIKSVLPTIAPELDYGNLDDVADGGQAQLAYLEATHPETSTQRRAELDKALRRYCGRDTLAMVRLVGALSGL